MGFIAFIAIVLWSLNFIFIKTGLKYMDIQTFNLIRFSFALPLMYFFKPTQKISQLLIITLFWNVINFNCMGFAIQNGMEISLASLIIQSTFMFTLFFTYVLNKEKHGQDLFLTVPLCLVGLYFFFHEALQAKADLLGIFLVLISAASGGFAYALIRYFKTESSLGNTIWLSGLAALLQVPLNLGLKGLDQIGLPPLESLTFPLISFLGSTICANYLWIYVNKRLTSSFLSHMMLLVPVLTVGFGVALYGEKLGTYKILGGSLIIVSVLAPKYLNRRIAYENS